MLKLMAKKLVPFLWRQKPYQFAQAPPIPRLRWRKAAVFKIITDVAIGKKVEHTEI